MRKETQALLLVFLLGIAALVLGSVFPTLSIQQDTRPPMVAIVWPSDGALVNISSGHVAVVVRAEDDSGLLYVKLYYRMVGEDAWHVLAHTFGTGEREPYSALTAPRERTVTFHITDATPGDYEMYAEACDIALNTATTTYIEFTAEEVPVIAGEIVKPEPGSTLKMGIVHFVVMTTGSMPQSVYLLVKDTSGNTIQTIELENTEVVQNHAIYEGDWDTSSLEAGETYIVEVHAVVYGTDYIIASGDYEIYLPLLAPGIPSSRSRTNIPGILLLVGFIALAGVLGFVAYRAVRKSLSS